MFDQQIIGTCSLCGGAVTVPSLWWGVVPPIPTCTRCGAVQQESYGPVIPMKPQKHRWTLRWDRSAASDGVTLDDAHDRYPLTSTTLCIRL